NDNSFPAVLSVDGRFVAFGSGASNLVTGDFNSLPDVFLYDRQAHSTVALSLAQDGQGGGAIPDLPPAISSDGRFVIFASQADNLISNDDNEVSDIFVFDRETGSLETLTLTSLGATQPRTANGASAGPAISDDGCLVAFYSDASNLVASDTNSARDVFVRNRCSGEIERASVNGQGEQGDGPSEAGGGAPGISADGRFVVFFSNARNLDPADTSGTRNIYIRDRLDGTTRLVSLGLNGEPANGGSQTPSVSADGRFVAFQSLASNLVADDTNGRVDVFVADVTSGEIRLVSQNAGGASPQGDSSTPQISSDGGAVVFQSSAQLSADDSDNFVDIYVASNPFKGGVLEPTSTATATVHETEGVQSPSATETPVGGEGTATPTPTATVFDQHPTVTPTRTAASGIATPTPTRSAAPALPTATAKTSGGGGGGGCGCRIDPATGGVVPDSPLPALVLPAVLWFLRRRIPVASK
ncbi:MAG: PD40 domain-containing protein, partial [Deltaproteobacteria bacterium]|nr:PD40 domain-containing protein [Deltaproteobacteria bacterium]